jgi:poly-gamma-glutamate synthesis protein (capsule biosynthesis protein)
MKNKYVLYSIIAFLILIGVVSFISYDLFFKNKKTEEKQVEEKVEEPVVVEPVIEESELSIVMVGDCLIHGAIYIDAQDANGNYNFYKMIDKIKPIIKGYDLAFYNQESLLGGTKLGLSSYPRFNAPQEVGDAFIDAGFNLVSLANNHSLDKGEKGILSSLEYWRKKEKDGIMTAGSYTSFEDRDRVVIMEKNGISYALLSYTTTTNGLTRPSGKEYLVNVYNKEQVKKDIERLRGKVDLLMVAMHWGEEYTHTPNAEQEEIAHYLADLGVDIIIGHHPHVIQPVEFIGNTMVIYSLGNFIASQKGAIEKHTGLMMSVTVHKKSVDGEVTITLENPTANLSYVYSIPSGSTRYGYEMYTYDMLNDNLLSGYHDYFNKYMKIVTSRTDKILYNPI